MKTRYILYFHILISINLFFSNSEIFAQNKKSDEVLKTILANETCKKAALKLLNADAPFVLDHNKALPQHKGSVDNFNPLMLKSISDLDRPLSPGDYSVDVIFYCTQWSIHRPGAGLPYKLGRAQGRLAKQMTALLFRGTLKKINGHTLNAMAWRIQGGVHLQKWSPEEQKLVHELIPEYENDLKGDYVQQFEENYNKLIMPLTKKNLDVQMLALGDIGKTVLNLKQSRQLLADKNIAADKLPEKLYDQNKDNTPLQLPPTKDKPSPWLIIQEGVIARFTVQQGNLGHNLLEFRVLENSGETKLKKGKGGGSVKENINSENEQTVTLNNIMNGTGQDAGKGLIGYSIGRAAQAPNVQPYLQNCFNNVQKITETLLNTEQQLKRRYIELSNWNGKIKTDVLTYFGDDDEKTKSFLLKRIEKEVNLIKKINASHFKNGEGEINSPCNDPSALMGVHPADPNHFIYICDHFCEVQSNNNSTIADVIHEISHFSDIGNTCDEPFNEVNPPGICQSIELAHDCPEIAKRNAYNFENFIIWPSENCDNYPIGQPINCNEIYKTSKCLHQNENK